MFETKQVKRIFDDSLNTFIGFLSDIDNLKLKQDIANLNGLKKDIDWCLNENPKWTDVVFNELYLFNSFIDLLTFYSETWQLIVKNKFSDSWKRLQDSIDTLRTIKKLGSNPDSKIVAFFENQLLELEKLYPYNVFFSIGIIVNWFECSICGKDIDSFDCIHFKGEIYRGKLACGIANKIKQVDHVSIVTNPEDKRCVIEYDDASSQFDLVRYLSESLNSRKLSPLNFHQLEFKKLQKENPAFKKLGRNESCFCGSGKKFKKCCIDKRLIEYDHVDIIGKQTKASPFEYLFEEKLL